jgi:hypothetical protein
VNGFERGADFPCLLVTVTRLLFQAALEDGAKSWRKLRRKRRERVAKDPGSQFEAGLATERSVAGRHFVEGYAQRPDITAGTSFFAPQNFRRDVWQRSNDRARITSRLRRTGGLREFALAIKSGKTKVQNLHLAGRSDHDIGRLDVAVDDAAVMCMGERGGDLRSVACHQLWTQASQRDQRIERPTLDELHHDEMVAGGFSHFVDSADVWVV